MQAPPLIFSLVGSTASGKTALALAFAQNWQQHRPQARVHLLSADSRQIYQGLEILTGADIPANWQQIHPNNFPYPVWQAAQQPLFLHGVSIIRPDQDWSAAHFYQLFLQLKQQLRPQDVLIVVGGTAFYQKQLQGSAATLNIPPLPELRQHLNQEKLAVLQTHLALLAPERLLSMNHSDHQNPRRLIRAIEVATYLLTQPMHNSSQSKPLSDRLPCLFLSSAADRENLIRQRVMARFPQAQQEVAHFLEDYPDLSLTSPACLSTGFLPLRAFVRQELSLQTCVDLWVQSEIRYAKQQDTWWKRYPDLITLSGQTILEKQHSLFHALRQF